MMAQKDGPLEKPQGSITNVLALAVAIIIDVL